jgi:uncharacterized oxidoreductase
MKTTGNTILITGGGSGIGRALAEAFHDLGNHVVIAGRRKQALDQTTAANPGMTSLMLDIEDRANIRAFAGDVAARYPALNVLINNAGIMRREKLEAQPEDLADAEAIVATNLLGPIRLTAALLPLLQKQPHSAIMNVSSGLAFVPIAPTPPIARPRPPSIPTHNRCAISSGNLPPRFWNSSLRMSPRT